jgi:large subunit ribosomal protein L9
MKVILTKDVAGLGKRTDVVEVKPGHARNYLLPQRLALPVTDHALKSIQHQIRAEELKLSKKKQQAETLAKAINEISCTATVQAGDEDRLYGSVTAADIAELMAQQGIKIDKRKIELEEPIKKLGVYNIPIRLHPEVEATVKLWVVRQ